MKIAVNTRLLIKDKLEGIGWFTFENFKRIVTAHPEHEFYFLFDRQYSDEFIFADNVHPVIVHPPTRHPLLWMTWFEYFLPRALKKIKPDLFVSPDGYLSLKTDVPQLAVIHDINFVHRPKDLPLSSKIYYQYYFPLFAQKAKRIVTVSCFSRDDICASYNIDSSKIDVVCNGANMAYKPLTAEEIKATKKKYSSGSDYFLFIGALHPRKNVSGLLNAFDKFVRHYHTDHKVVIVGEKMFLTAELDQTYNQMRYGDDVLFTGRLSTDELRDVLGAATALVFVPFFEGFGIPIVEAMYADVPVICSNTTSLPEVAGDAALYVNPDDTDEIAAAMHKISTDEPFRQELIAKGREQRKKFSWDLSAKLLWESIEKCLRSISANNTND
ncbi:MAG: glycosyltransferase family 1 protein [Bacteroidota bacterium]|nr:glycosyltransferase family 1 protein [Bacteroidota bacterium]